MSVSDMQVASDAEMTEPTDRDLATKTELREDGKIGVELADTPAAGTEAGYSARAQDPEQETGAAMRNGKRYLKPIVHTIVWLLFTAYVFHLFIFDSRWWVCGLVLHRDRWLIPSLLYISFTLWLIFQYIPLALIS